MYLENFSSYFFVLMSTFKNKNSLRTIEAQIVQKLKNNEARPKFTGSYKKKACNLLPISALQKENAAVIEEQNRAM